MKITEQWIKELQTPLHTDRWERRTSETSKRVIGWLSVYGLGLEDTEAIRRLLKLDFEGANYLLGAIYQRKYPNHPHAYMLYVTKQIVESPAFKMPAIPGTNHINTMLNVFINGPLYTALREQIIEYGIKLIES